jgi:predicted short-subunit dehydrogenase-like oxidoreductase (DUF2520 family)
MIQVSIIGSGNVAIHLINAFSKSTEIELVQVFSRNKNAVAHLIPSDKIINSFNQLKSVDVIIIAILDEAIEKVSAQIPFQQLVVHTSGTIPMEAINNKHNKGVFYPLQTFSKSKEVDFLEIPICLESETEKDYETLTTIAKSTSNIVYNLNSEQRKALHIAAVFVSNFVNHLYKIGYDICKKNKLPFEILQPLIKETANKINTISPVEAQTGPASRNDTQTINTHLIFLTVDSEKEIYKLLTKSIIDNGKKL